MEMMQTRKEKNIYLEHKEKCLNPLIGKEILDKTALRYNF